jgi:hypothetical protein
MSLSRRTFIASLFALPLVKPEKPNPNKLFMTCSETGRRIEVVFGRDIKRVAAVKIKRPWNVKPLYASVRISPEIAADHNSVRLW